MWIILNFLLCPINGTYSSSSVNNIYYKGPTKSLRTGMRIDAVAVLETTSVTMVVIREITNTIRDGGKKSKYLRRAPSQRDRPDFLPASARANPPPWRRMTSQGNFLDIARHVRHPGGGSAGLPSEKKWF